MPREVVGSVAAGHQAEGSPEYSDVLSLSETHRDLHGSTASRPRLPRDRTHSSFTDASADGRRPRAAGV